MKLSFSYENGLVQEVCVSDIEKITKGENNKILIWCKTGSIHEGQIYCVTKAWFSWL